MAYVAPNGTIKLIHDCPLNSDYDHTVNFSSPTAQFNAFNALTKYTFTNQSYTRLERGKIRVAVCADDVYDCNYLMYQNGTFGNKWFYAFINSIEYINNVTTEINFEIDVLQTWQFEYSLQACYVEREHISSDTLGANYENEGIDCGEYIFNDYQPILSGLQNLGVIMAIVDVSSATVEGNIYDGMYGGAELWYFDVSDYQAIDTKISSFIDRPDAVVGLYMIPKLLVNLSSGTKITNRSTAWGNAVTGAPLTSGATLDGYTPRNKKLLMYPYNFYHVDDANGTSLTLRYEFFKTASAPRVTDYTPKFYIGGTLTQPVSVILRPSFYKGSGDGSGGDFNIAALKSESLTLSNYPLCSWNSDAYDAWVAQNSIPLILKSFSSLAGGAVASTYSRHPEGQIGSSALGLITSILAENYSASIAADLCKGQMNNGSINNALKTQQFYGGRCSITAKKAAVIDSFFDMYGYATNQIKIPNINSRPYFNYVKTINCNIRGQIGREDERKITEIFNKGITFWKNMADVGDYGKAAYNLGY